MSLADLGIGAAIRQGQAGTIDDIAKVVDERLPNRRQCLIQFQNSTAKHELINSQSYVPNGHNEKPLPSNVGVGMETTMLFTKTDQKASAVMVYDLKDPTLADDNAKSFILIFSVPYDYSLHDNCFSMFLFPNHQKGDKRLYDQMSIMLDDTLSPDRHDQSLTMKKHGFSVEATMTATDRPNLVVQIYDIPLK